MSHRKLPSRMSLQTNFQVLLSHIRWYDSHGDADGGVADAYKTVFEALSSCPVHLSSENELYIKEVPDGKFEALVVAWNALKHMATLKNMESRLTGILAVYREGPDVDENDRSLVRKLVDEYNASLPIAQEVTDSWRQTVGQYQAGWTLDSKQPRVQVDLSFLKRQYLTFLQPILRELANARKDAYWTLLNLASAPSPFPHLVTIVRTSGAAFCRE